MCNLSTAIENKARGEGKLLTLIDLVQDGSLDIEIAAAKAKMTVDEFRKTMEEAPLQAV